MSIMPGPPAGKKGRWNWEIPDRSAAPGGLLLLACIVGLMWLVEAINSLDSSRLDAAGIHARDPGRLWGIATSPFIHASFQHLLDNTVPLIFLGVLIALRGAARLAVVTAGVMLVGGFGTWLISPSHTAYGVPISTIGASGIVFGYATYLLSRGVFDRSVIEALVGVFVGLIWGGALISSLEPQEGVSWQAHASGAVAGVLVAWWLSSHDRRPGSIWTRPAAGSGPPGPDPGETVR